jgi:hypothetical protein
MDAKLLYIVMSYGSGQIREYDKSFPRACSRDPVIALQAARKILQDDMSSCIKMVAIYRLKEGETMPLVKYGLHSIEVSSDSPLMYTAACPQKESFFRDFAELTGTVVASGERNQTHSGLMEKQAKLADSLQRG